MRFLQSRQWHTDTRTGSPVTVALSWPQRQEAVRVVTSPAPSRSAATASATASTGRRGAGQHFADRGALLAHLFIGAGHRDDRPAGLAFQRAAVEQAAAVDHREDRGERHLRPLLLADMLLDLVERAARQDRGDHRHDRQVGGAQDLVRRVGQAGRAVDDDPVIIADEVRRDLGQPLALAEIVEGIVEVAQRFIGRQHVEAGRFRSAGSACDGSASRVMLCFGPWCPPGSWPRM